MCNSLLNQGRIQKLSVGDDEGLEAKFSGKAHSQSFALCAAEN